MQVTLYNFNKRINSTKRPTDGSTYNGFLRNSDPVSMFNPTVRFDFNSSNAPTYNYAFIPEFGNRYYFITDWVHNEGVWECSLSVDTLATYKDVIGNKESYVLRASAEYDTYVVDTKYPATANISKDATLSGDVSVRVGGELKYTTSNVSFWSIGFNYGTIILGIFGPDGNGIDYYAMSPQWFSYFAEQLYDYNPLDDKPNWWEGLTQGVAKSISNPMQYIASCMWLPFNYSRIWTRENIDIKLGLWSVGLSGNKLDVQGDMPMIDLSFNLPKHPQQSRGLYLNSSPFTNYSLYMYPFGTININSDSLINDTSLRCQIYTDYITGHSKLVLTSLPSAKVIGSSEGKLGVDINVGNATVDLVGIATSLGRTLGSFLSSKYVSGTSETRYHSTGKGPGTGYTETTNTPGHWTGSNPAAALGGFASKLLNSAPTLETSGGSGGLLAFTYNLSDAPLLLSFFSIIVDEYNEEIGRPLCKVRYPKNIPGFIQTNNVSISTGGTTQETEEVANFMNGGFFYE